MANSDHYHFARHGIPTLRLVAGFDQADSNVRHVLIRNHRRDEVALLDLQAAARFTAMLAWRALTMGEAELATQLAAIRKLHRK